MNDLKNYHMSWFWQRGPREWSPRRKRVLEDCRKLHDAIPREMIVTRSADLSKTGEIVAHDLGNGRTEACIIAFMVRISPKYEHCERVWISSRWTLSMGIGIVQLLNGQLSGFEHLAGRWPWTVPIPEVAGLSFSPRSGPPLLSPG